MSSSTYACFSLPTSSDEVISQTARCVDEPEPETAGRFLGGQPPAGFDMRHLLVICAAQHGAFIGTPQRGSGMTDKGAADGITSVCPHIRSARFPAIAYDGAYACKSAAQSRLRAQVLRAK